MVLYCFTLYYIKRQLPNYVFVFIWRQKCRLLQQFQICSRHSEDKVKGTNYLTNSIKSFNQTIVFSPFTPVCKNKVDTEGWVKVRNIQHTRTSSKTGYFHKKMPFYNNEFIFF